MNRVRKELELLKSWGFETVSIDKVPEMIEKADDTEVEPDGKSVINIFYSPCDKKERDGVDKYFREIPVYVRPDRSYPLHQDIYCTGTSIPEPNVWIF